MRVKLRRMQFVPLGDGLKDFEAATQKDSGPESSLCCLHGLLKWIMHPQQSLLLLMAARQRALAAKQYSAVSKCATACSVFAGSLAFKFFACCSHVLEDRLEVLQVWRACNLASYCLRSAACRLNRACEVCGLRNPVLLQPERA